MTKLLTIVKSWFAILSCMVSAVWCLSCEAERPNSTGAMPATGKDADTNSALAQDSEEERFSDTGSDTESADTHDSGDAHDGDRPNDTETVDESTGAEAEAETDTWTADNPCIDEDSDGWCSQFDCDDFRGDVNPDAAEVYGPPNNVDEDCDGLTDEEPESDDYDTDTSPGFMLPDCSNCLVVGDDLGSMRCAIDLCDDTVFRGQSYTSPSHADTDGTHAALARFGENSNDLEPLLNGAYALMATGPARGDRHNVSKGGDLGGVEDPFSQDTLEANDVMEWRLHLKAPEKAHGFRIHYVFFSEEYDDFIDSIYNDKFYVFLEAASTNGGSRTVINFTKCRNPEVYSDFVCDAETMGFCDDGDKYCYIAINSALSECCWYGGCPNGIATTDIAGTGFTCAEDDFDDSSGNGSSTGWLVTEWNIEPLEEFDIIFHIHDTADHIYDSEVILDKFIFLKDATPGTHVL